MIQYNEIEETKKIKVQKSITCDCCGKTKSLINSLINSFEWCDANNFIKIRKEFGYGSEVGDEEKVSIDICEQCFIEKFGIELIRKCVV